MYCKLGKSNLLDVKFKIELIYMIFTDNLKKLKDLKLPADEFVLVGSSAMGVRGIRESNDLDIIVSDDLWKMLAQKYPVTKEWGIDKIKIEDDIEILGEGSVFRDSQIAPVDEIIRTADVFDGIHYINLELLKKFKQKLGREKDYKDIELIDAYLAQHK